MTLFYRTFLFFFFFFLVLGGEKSFALRPPVISHIDGAKSFYITDHKARPKEVKVGSRIPFGSQFKLPPRVSVKVSYSPSLFFLASNETQIRILKRKKRPLIRILYGKMRLLLKPKFHWKKKRKKKSLSHSGFYLEANEFVSFLVAGDKKSEGDFLFERSPLRTALYNLKGRAWTAGDFSRLEKKKFFVKLKPLEYTYGRLDRAFKFKKKHSYKSKLFFKNLSSSSPYLVRHVPLPSSRRKRK